MSELEKSMRELGEATMGMAPRGPGIGLLMLRAELARAAGREARLASIASVSGFALLGLALVAVCLRIPASAEPLTLLPAALPVVLGAIFGGFALVDLGMIANPSRRAVSERR